MQENALDLTIDRNYRAYEKKKTEDFFAQKAEKKRQAVDLFATIKQQIVEKNSKGSADKEADLWQAETWRREAAEAEERERKGAARRKQTRKDLDATLFDAMLSRAGAHKSEQGISDKTRHRELLLNRPFVERMALSGFKPDKTVPLLIQATAQKVA